MDRGPMESTYPDTGENISHDGLMEKLANLLTKNKVLVTDLQTEPRFQNGKRFNGKVNGNGKKSHISI